MERQNIDQVVLTGTFGSIMFWLAITLAALMFGAVTISPRLLVSWQLEQETAANQRRLVAMEHQNERLKSMIDALEHDPQFAGELARTQFDATRPGEEVLPVDPSLHWTWSEPTEESPGVVWPWYAPAVYLCATVVPLRTALLVGASFLAVGSFTLLVNRRSVSLADASPVESR